MTVRKYHRELLRQLPRGYRIAFREVRDGPNEAPRKLGRHPVLLDPDGQVVKSPGGQPVAVCGTPGDRRSFKTDLAAIQRAGVPIR